VQRTKIEYADLAWNPVKGICPGGCSYCYAREMYRRFHIAEKAIKTSSFPGAVIIEEEIESPLHRRKPARIFAFTTYDPLIDPGPVALYGMLRVMKETPRHTYLLLTKHPEMAGEIFKFPPENLWLGVTVTAQCETRRIELLRQLPAPVKWVSFEPLLEPVWNVDLEGSDWIVIGRQTGRSPLVRPSVHWLWMIHDAARKADAAVFFKNNLLSLNDVFSREPSPPLPLVQEFPWKLFGAQSQERKGP
jgi:protein gp37